MTPRAKRVGRIRIDDQSSVLAETILKEKPQRNGDAETKLKSDTRPWGNTATERRKY